MQVYVRTARSKKSRFGILLLLRLLSSFFSRPSAIVSLHDAQETESSVPEMEGGQEAESSLPEMEGDQENQ